MPHTFHCHCDPLQSVMYMACDTHVYNMAVICDIFHVRWSKCGVIDLSCPATLLNHCVQL